MSLLIGNDLVVSINFTLTDDDGNKMDSSEDSEPLAYLHGAGQIIPGLENALVGKVEGDSLKVRIEPADGYGDVKIDLIQTVKKEDFQGAEAIEPGMVFEAELENGNLQHIVVTEVDGEEVTVDANHPLAGVVLHFDVEVVGVTEATDEELSEE